MLSSFCPLSLHQFICSTFCVGVFNIPNGSLMDTLSPTNIFGVYQETGKPTEEVENAHTSIGKRVTECEERGQNVNLMGYFNAPLNVTEKPFIPATKKILEWEETGGIRILNDKQIPTRVSYRKGDTANCLDLMMITKGLVDRTKYYKFDVDREWTPARVERTGQALEPYTPKEKPVTTWPRK